MNKTQILIALVLLSIIGMSGAHFEVFNLISEQLNPNPTDNLKHGEIRQYTKDNRLRTIINYDRGVKHGFSYLYYDDGETLLLAMPYANGKRQGIAKKYYASGKLYATTSYHENLLHGPRSTYFKSGQIRSVVNYGYGFPGIGTTEYLLDGTEKTANTIVADRRGQQILLSTAAPCKETNWFIGTLVEDTYLNPQDENIKPLPFRKGEEVIDLSVYTPSYLQYQDIICECTSSQNNPLIMKVRLF